jgi:hypothetical protein
MYVAQVSSSGLQNIFFTIPADGGSVVGKIFTISLFSGGQNKITTTATANSSGLIPFSANLSPGTYSVRIGTNGFLSREQVFNVTSNQTFSFTNRLLAGDLNNDGVINSLDWSSMSFFWFTSVPEDDLNSDGIVNSLDRALLIRNWFLRADDPISTAVVPPPRTTYDWCASIVIRPDALVSGPPACTPRISKIDTAQADTVFMTGEYSVASSETSTHPPLRFQSANSCWYDGYLKPSNTKLYTDELKALRSPTLPPLTSIYATRFDIITSPKSQVTGFQASWAVDSATPWADFQSFIASDRTADCASGCRWSDSDPAESASLDGVNTGYRLRDALDRSSGPNTYQKKVYYLTRGSAGETVFAPNAIVMRQDNPEYQKWVVALAKKEMQESGATYVDLNQKFAQYQGDRYLGDYPGGLTTWNRADSSYFTGLFLNYGLAQYVAGWRGIANELIRQGVPYEVTVGQWFVKTGGTNSNYYDDPLTLAINEADVIRSVVYDADLVLLDGPIGAMDSLKAEILSHGNPRIIEINSDCGLATS